MRGRKQITKETLRKIYDGYVEQGKSLKTLAQETGLSVSYIRQLLLKMKKAGLPVPIGIRQPINQMIEELKREVMHG